MSLCLSIAIFNKVLVPLLACVRLCKISTWCQKMDSLPTPQKVSTDGDQWRNWREFREEGEDYEIATGVAEKSDAVRVATLKTVMGREAAGNLKRLSLSAEDKKTTKQVLDALEKHFKPRKNEIYESFIFNSRVNSPENPFSSTCPYFSN